MQEQQEGGWEYHLPPVELPRIPEEPVKKIEDQVVKVEDRFREELVKVDPSSIESMEYLSDASMLAVGCGSGVIKVLSVAQNNVQFVLKGQDHSPVTGLASNPNSGKLRHAFMAIHSQGMLEYWHATSSQLLFSKKYDEMLQSCEISPEGTHYAFAGELGRIRLGQLNKGDPVEVQGGHLGKHDNRVFCLKWNPSDNNLLLSGGWDQSVYFWDIRVKTSVHHIYGHYIGGQAIDFKGNEVLLGNNKPDHQLKIYDMKAQKSTNVSWMLTDVKQAHYTTGVLSCFFNKQAPHSFVACTPKNQVRLFEGNVMTSEHSLEQRIAEEQEEQAEQGPKLYCMQYDGRSRKVATGWSDGSIRWLQF